MASPQPSVDSVAYRTRGRTVNNPSRVNDDAQPGNSTNNATIEATQSASNTEPPADDNNESLSVMLERLRQWRQNELDKAELARLLEQRRRYEQGDIDALLAPPNEPNSAKVAQIAPSVALPRPKDPHLYRKLDRRDFNLWKADCDAYFTRAPQHFPTEELKADFASRYLSEELIIIWRLECSTNTADDPTWVPTWPLLQDKMLNALGTPYERRLRASADLKLCKQRPGQSPTELLNYMRNLWEEIAPVSLETQAIDFVNALHPWIQKDLALQDSQKRLSLRDCEEMANISYRRQADRKDPAHGKKRRRGGKPEDEDTSDNRDHQDKNNDSTKTPRGQQQPKK